MKIFLILSCFYFLIFVNINAYSQTFSEIEKLTEEPVLDGKPFEAAWEQIHSKVLFMLNPISGGASTQKSEAKVGFTEKYLYAAGYLYDNEPDKIRASSKKRDEISLTNDFFGLILDTYNDKENAVTFSTNPNALRLDYQIFNDGQGDFPVEISWNTVWEVETSKNSEGWFVEMRIPLSSLRYSIKDGKVQMGLSIFRYISRLSEWDIYPKISNEWGFWSWAKASQYEDISLSGIKSINPLYFSPYLLGGLEQKNTLNDSSTAYSGSNQWEKQIGLDMKIGLSKSLTLDLTANTDFAQVEADNQQLNLTRFSLFFPEKRQFFLERSSIFDFKFGNTGQLFYSRNIGLFEGQKIPIWGGGRMTGRAGLWDIGVMSLQTAPLNDEETDLEILPSMNNSVIRLRRKIPINSNSYLGGLVTSKVDVNGKYNVSYGLDAIVNLFKNDYLNVAVASTTESDLEPGKEFMELSELYVQWERRTYKGLSYNLNYTRSGNSFNPALGFQFRSDFSLYGANVAYGFIPGDKSKHLKQHQFSIETNTYLKNIDNSVETVNITPRYSFATKKDHSFSFRIPTLFEYNIDTFHLSDDVYVPAGSYSFSDFHFSYDTPQGKFISFSTGFSAGKFYDGNEILFYFGPTLTPGGSWILNLNYNYNDINFSERNQRFIAQFFSFSALYMYSTKTSASSFIQYNNLDKQFVWNVRFRYNPKEGNDLYLVYNDFINSSRNDYSPNLPFSNQRTILIKYTHTFRVR